MSSTSARQWTDAQRDAISATGSLLVSAAAGSGKTSVLAERCAYLVCEAPQRCQVSELCVVTFTEAAAAEMRSRIESTLRRRLAAAGSDPHLRRQLALIDQAQVSTLHAFCMRLLRQNFHQLGLDPDFRVLDADEAALLRVDVARDLFLARYDGEQSDDFRAFIDALGNGQDDLLDDQVIRLHETISSLVDPMRWLNGTLSRLLKAAGNPLGGSELGQHYLQSLSRQVGDLLADLRWTIATLGGMGFAEHAAYLGPVADDLSRVAGLLASREYDRAVAAYAPLLELPRAPSISAGRSGGEVARMLFERARDGVSKKGPLAEPLRFTTAQWQASLNLVIPHAKVLLQLVLDFARQYKLEKARQRVLDFSDLERHALRLLADPKDAARPSPVARELHRRFRHVLVDEYQDINELQDAILNLLSRECLAAAAPDAANLFCVGDVKQSIYGFRLADPRRFLARDDAFRHAHPYGRVIDLQANFRSRAPLLQAVNAIFARIMRREAVDIEYDQSHELIPRAEFADAADGTTFRGAPIELHLLPHELDRDEHADADDSADLERSGREALQIARRIRRMMGADGAAPMQVSQRLPDGSLGARPVRYGDMVILLRAMRYHSQEFAQVLRDAGIPVYNAEGGGYFNATEVRDIVSLLCVLDNRLQDIPMAAVLRSPIARLPHPDDALARVRLAYPKVPFARAVLSYAAGQQDELAGRLQAILAQLDRWREVARHRPVADLLWQIYEESGYLAYVAALESGPRRVANLLALYDRARQFGSFSRQGLYRFNRFLADLDEQADPAQAAEVTAAEDVVRIMSVHKSKGLEFPVVFLPQMGKAFNLSSADAAILVDRDAGLGIPAVDTERRAQYPSLAQVVIQQRLLRESLAEEMRILYVALTRAREHLVLVGTATEKQQEHWRRRWAGHDGPMPATDILGARSFLSWLAPVAEMRHAHPPLEVFAVPPEEMSQWLREHTAVSGPIQPDPLLVAMQPLDPTPAPVAAADASIARLAYQYPHASFTTLHATAAVTSLAKHGEAGLHRVDLKPPKRLAGSAALTGTDLGSATHLFLEHLDFGRPAELEDLRSQLEDVLQRKLLTPQQAAACDLEAVAWFLDTDLGRLLRAHAAELLRELPVVYPVPADRFDRPPSTDPLDSVLVRGRVDLLAPDGDGFVLVDYKTDSVNAEGIPARAAVYRAQLELYREALERIIRKPVRSSHLVFFQPRQIVNF